MSRLSDQYEKEGVDYSFPIILRDNQNRQTYYENSIGDWCSSEYDARGNLVHSRTSEGFWWKRTFDKKNNVKEYINSDGVVIFPNIKNARHIRVVIVDDDPITGMYMRARLAVKLKDIGEVLIDVMTEPLIVPGYDVYIIDNQFNEMSLASILVADARRTAPESLIITMSATLDYRTIALIVNRGCNGVYDKSNPLDNETVIDMLINYTKALQEKIETAKARVCLLTRIIKRVLNLFGH